MSVQQKFSLQAFNTFGIDANCQYFSAFSSIHELDKLIQNSSKPLTILGGGSNILLTKNIRKVELQLRDKRNRNYMPMHTEEVFSIETEQEGLRMHEQ